MKKVQKRMKAQPGGVIRFTTCGERRKYKPAAAVHTAPAAAPASSELRTCESFCAARSSASRRASNACIRLRIRSSAASSALDDMATASRTEIQIVVLLAVTSS